MKTYLRRNIFKIILLFNSVINVTFHTCSNQNVITITTCCFIIFYKDATSNYLVSMVFILFSSYKELLDFYEHLKLSRIGYLLH